MFLAKSSKKGKKEKEDPNVVKPTRAISSYIFFSNETIPKLKEEKKIAHKDAMGEAGKIWNKMSDDEKKPFDKMHEEDVKRYEKQLKELKDKGYFIMADGTKSSDHVVASKKRKAKSETKPGNKRGSAVSAAGKKGAEGKAKKGANAKSKKSDDDLDIESEEESHKSDDIEESA